MSEIQLPTASDLAEWQRLAEGGMIIFWPYEIQALLALVAHQRALLQRAVDDTTGALGSPLADHEDAIEHLALYPAAGGAGTG